MTRRDQLLFDALHGVDGEGPLGEMAERMCNYWARYGDTCEGIDCVFDVPELGRARIVLAILPVTPPFARLGDDLARAVEEASLGAVATGEFEVEP